MPNTPNTPTGSLSYRDAGVDIARGEALVERIRSSAESSRRAGVMGGLGGFGGLFDLAATGYSDPVLVSSTDGVGTKLMLAIDSGRHDTIGIDLVAMCVNDIVVQGAEPLFFLDYFATGRLDVDVAETVVRGIAAACTTAGAALLGGETAEMPGMYGDAHYDLAGFAVGVVERERLIDGSRVAAGDVVLGLASDGVHANGYSLVRKIIETSGSQPDLPLAGRPLIDHLLAPTRIYVRPLLEVMQSHSLHALAHVTGGGITENLPRVLPASLDAVIDLESWSLPPVFDWLQTAGRVAGAEMLTTFNCGIGMIVVVAEQAAAAVQAQLEAAGETVITIGEIADGTGKVRYQGKLELG